jgi:zinc D-Ala-D-Ala dipeptidase
MIFALFLSASLAIDRPADLVEVTKAIPGIVLDIRYATTRNFTHTKLYPADGCYLVRGVAVRLLLVQRDLQKKGLGLKIYDGYRPLSVARMMWALVHDGRYVANPARGRNLHCRGAAVDVTLVDRQGKEIPMPSEFDDFGDKGHRDYRGGTAAARLNRETLGKAMMRRGFKPLSTEWWHFDAPDWKRYPVRDGYPK